MLTEDTRDAAPPKPSSTGRAGVAWTVFGVALVLCASWMGLASGGFFTAVWAPTALTLGLLALLAAVTGALRLPRSRWSAAAATLFVLYGLWSLASMLWSANPGDAWAGTGLTILYVLGFLLALASAGQGADRRWVLAASALGPAAVAALTLLRPGPARESLFESGRLIGTLGYHNAEAAFLLVPLWAAIYVAGSRRIGALVRSLVLAGAVVSLSVAVMAQSRGAMVALVLSIPVFFLLSGQRLRGLIALAPLAAALFSLFPGLNDVYLASRQGGDPAGALDLAAPNVWLAAGGVLVYGLVWGALDRRWIPPAVAVRAAGGLALAVVLVVLAISAAAFVQREGSPVAWTEQKWEAFKTNDATGQGQSRYLSASGSGRYDIWQVAWRDFVTHPVLGVGTHNYEATYYRLREVPAGWVRQPHSLQLEVLAERGAVGGVLFFGFLAVCVAGGLRSRFGDLDADGKAQAGAMITCLAYWFVHSGAEWFWQIPAVTLPAIVYLALLAAPWGGEPEAAPAHPAVRALLAAGAVLAVAAVAPLYAADRYLTRSEAAPNPWMALQAVERAQVFNPLDPVLALREAELRARIGDWPRAVEAYERAISLNPEHYAPYVALAEFYARRGETERALDLYEKARERNPLDGAVAERARKLAEEKPR